MCLASLVSTPGVGEGGIFTPVGVGLVFRGSVCGAVNRSLIVNRSKTSGGPGLSPCVSYTGIVILGGF